MTKKIMLWIVLISGIYGQNMLDPANPTHPLNPLNPVDPLGIYEDEKPKGETRPKIKSPSITSNDLICAIFCIVILIVWVTMLIKGDPFSLNR